MPPSSRSVGVDFGTTTCLIAEGVAGRQPRVFPIGRTTSYLPSLVGLDGSGRMQVGDEAADLAAERVRRSIKRCITRDQQMIDLPDGTAFNADDGISALLADLALKARSGGVELSDETTRLGCPAMWTGAQRMRLLNLAERAGLPVSDHTLIDEPVAAGVAWVNREVQRTGGSRAVVGKLLVFDMGGGTLDVALLDVHAEPGAVAEISVLSSWGIDEAGDALDDAIARDLESSLAHRGVDVDGLRARGDLVLDAARAAKLRLSTTLETPVAVRFPGLEIPEVQFTREQLDVAFDDQLRRAERLVWTVLRGARVTHEAVQSPSDIRAIGAGDLVSDVDFVLLAGGMARIPAVARMIERIFPGADLHVDLKSADEAIVSGLGETVAYDRINLHRPPLNFVLELDGGGAILRMPVYDAYSPFYPPHFASSRTDLFHEWRPARGTLPSRGTAQLCIYTPAGELIPLRLDGVGDGVIQVPLGNVQPSVRIYPNGRVQISDGRRAVTEFLVPRWPVIRGKDHAFLVARRNQHKRAPAIEHPWQRDPLFLH